MLLRKFYHLLVLTCRRKRLPPQPFDWFRHLLASVGTALTIRVASKEGRPVASILTLNFKGSLVYKYSCSDSKSNSLGGTPFLLWNAIHEAKRSGLRELDFGRSDCHMPGLVTFKDRWGTTRSVINYLRCPTALAPSVSAGWAMRFAKQFFARMPDTLLIVAGKMFYRHVGFLAGCVRAEEVLEFVSRSA